MNEGKLAKTVEFFREAALREMLEKAEEIVEPVGQPVHRKRVPFERYSYGQQEEQTKRQIELKYAEMEQQAKEQITTNINQYLFAEEMSRLTMEAYLLDHSIAIERNNIEEVKMKLKGKERKEPSLSSILKPEDREGVSTLSPIVQRPREQAQEEGAVKRLRIYPLQTVSIDPQRQEERPSIEQRMDQPKSMSQLQTSLLLDDKIKAKKQSNLHLTNIQKIEREILKCQQKLAISGEGGKERKARKKQCKRMVQSLWRQAKSEL